jgi:PGM1 C-terminal domain
LIDITTANHLHYDHRHETGVLFHLIGALSQYGKLGLTAIGNSHAEADSTYGRALEILDLETGAGGTSREAPAGTEVRKSASPRLARFSRSGRVPQRATDN